MDCRVQWVRPCIAAMNSFPDVTPDLPARKSPHGGDPFRWAVTGLGLVSLLILGTLFVYLIWESLPVLFAEGWNFVSGGDWWVGETYGALPMIYGSFLVTGVALIFVLPLALGGAVFTSEFLSPGYRLIVKAMMELFAGVPGIIYGLLGVTLLAEGVKNLFGLIDGNTLLTAGLLLGVMVLPTIMTLSEDALHAVPGQVRDTGLSLGMTQWQTVAGAVIPQALPGIGGAIFLGLGRAMGETIAVMLVIGGLDKIPAPWYNLFAPGQSIPSKLGREAAEAIGSGLHWNALMGLGLILFLMVMILTLAGNLLLKRVRS
ncbi:MAG: phosphate ABC transporter permease subunit PstC [Nitrospinaceae bacterium]